MQVMVLFLRVKLMEPCQFWQWTVVKVQHNSSSRLSFCIVINAFFDSSFVFIFGHSEL